MFWLFSTLNVFAEEQGEKNGKAGEGISLTDAVREAVAHNFSLAAREIELTFPETRLEIARSEFRWDLRPSVDVATGRERETAATAGVLAEKKFSPGAVFEVRAEWRYREEGRRGERVDLRLEQPLFQRFGKLAGYRYVDEASFQLESARLLFHRETESLILRVVTSYTSVLNQQERMEQEMSALSRAADLVRMVEVKRRQGRATGVEVLEMRMLHREAELRFRQAEERLVLFRSELAELLGRVSAQLPDPEPVDLNPLALPSLAEAERVARENRVERTRALLAYENARRQLTLEERERYPDVRLIGNYQPVSEEEDGDWFAGVRVGRNLDRHVIGLQIARQQQAVQGALLRIAATELQIHREVLQAHSRLKTLEREREIAEAQMELARERLRLARGLYPSGRTGSLQLRDAEEEWVAAQTQKTDVTLQQVRARYQFWYALGLLLGDPEPVPDPDPDPGSEQERPE